ncbi:MAG TPA: arsenic resistance N-acetyltransferase ArsN2 [Chitinophagaceae bacterium]|nr:arsenic resistance N-acetyltransferase ArsN2 [Chitinophagaceae bacterium]
MPITITAANETHRDEIIALLDAEHLPAGDLPGMLDNFSLAVDGDAVVGVAGLEQYGKYGLLRSVVVSSVYRNNRIALQLVNAVEKRAEVLGLKTIYLLTETAERYFAAKGYTTVQREEVPEAIKMSSEFSHVCPVSAAVMKKEIVTI